MGNVVHSGNAWGVSLRIPGIDDPEISQKMTFLGF